MYFTEIKLEYKRLEFLCTLAKCDCSSDCFEYYHKLIWRISNFNIYFIPLSDGPKKK